MSLFQVANEIVEDLFNNKPLNTINLETDIIKTAKQGIIRLLTDHDFNLKEITKVLQQREWSPEKINYFVKLLESKKTELLYQLVARHNSKYMETVTSFEWYLKLVLGTSELTALRYPLLQLFFNTMDTNGQQNKLLFDVDKNMINKLILTLEEINEP